MIKIIVEKLAIVVLFLYPWNIFLKYICAKAVPFEVERKAYAYTCSLVVTFQFTKSDHQQFSPNDILKRKGYENQKNDHWIKSALIF